MPEMKTIREAITTLDEDANAHRKILTDKDFGKTVYDSAAVDARITMIENIGGTPHIVINDGARHTRVPLYLDDVAAINKAFFQSIASKR